MKKQQYLEEGDCIHGFGRYQCAVCYHPKGSCDFGDCQEPATVRVHTKVYHRPCCAKHGTWLADWDNGVIEHIEQVAA